MENVSKNSLKMDHVVMSYLLWAQAREHNIYYVHVTEI